ncbi:aminocarboxymuconate-semialdehyde decarboxylase [Cystobasidium minutum MCA 4210]|uniref:aminocarboxymuconate-semialdehyde decarboxylase n=1 Tax=Cystobasidium minutum MCA 4210 TaxID=1397322 RepID=UPI0034CDAA84|eukprot:jgi/Rhomi1/83626/CE83625_151
MMDSKNIPPRIDMHSHFIPPAYKTALEQTGHSRPDGMPAIPPWSPEAHLEMAATVNVTKSYLSISSPGTHFVPGDKALARKVTREANEYAAELKRKQPEHFGYWASLCLPDVEGSLEELKYACDNLDPDGVVLETNAHGKYLGHPDFQPLFEELNRIKAVVFIHPTTPCMLTSHSGVGAARQGDDCQTISPLTQYPAPMMEFLFDTSRAIINMFMSGTISKYPDITYIVPHCGGTLGPLVDRFSVFASLVPDANVDRNITPDFVRSKLESKQFYFDMAGLAWPNQCKMIMPYTSAQRLLYGSDFPFTPVDKVEMLVKMMDKAMPETFASEKDLQDIYTNNAVELLKTKGWKSA